MALTLLEAAKRAANDGQVLRAGIIEIYARTSDILRMLPFSNIQGNALKYNREDALPGIGFRGVNEGYTESTGVINPEVEPLVIAGGDIDVDKFILDTMGQDQRTTQEAMKVKAMAHRISNTFIKGDSVTNSKEFDGLQRRLAGNQVIDQGATSGGDVLTLSALDELIDAVDDPNALLMSKAMRRTLTAAARDTDVGGFITYSLNEFGKRVTQYNDLPIAIADANADLFATLAFNEANPGGGSNVGTSIYCLEMGDGKLHGIQNGTMDVRDIGELESKPSLRSRVEWYMGLVLLHPRAAARLQGIKAGAATA